MQVNTAYAAYVKSGKKGRKEKPKGGDLLISVWFSS